MKKSKVYGLLAFIIYLVGSYLFFFVNQNEGIMVAVCGIYMQNIELTYKYAEK